MILNSPTISGSLTVTGNIITSGSITISGSIASASYATNAELLDGLDSTAFATTGAYSATSASLYATSASLSATSGSLSATSGSFNTRVTALEATGSALTSSLLTVSGSGYATSASLSTDSGSFNSRVATIESKYATTGSNNFRAPQYVSDTTVPTGFSNTTGSIYTDGGLQVTKDSYFSGSMFIKGNLTIYGTQSVAYITSSQLNIATNLITVNTATPSVRFGGLAVYDSGSTGTGATGSLLWDSQNNGWVYQRESGSTYAGGMLISGPRRALGSNLGDEQGLTACMIPVAQGGDHITSSLIYHDSTVTCIQTAVIGTSTACFASSVTAKNLILNGTATTALDLTSGTFSYGLDLNNNVFLRQKNVAGTLGLLLGLSVDDNLYVRGFSDVNIQVNNGTTALALASTGVATFSNNILIGAGKYLGYSSTAYMTPEDNIQGARIKTPGAFLVESTGATFCSSVTANNFYSTGTTGFWSDAYDVRRNGFYADGTNLIFRAGTSGTGEQTRMVIAQATGNVGIGTNNPSQILDLQAAGVIVKMKSTTGTNSVYTNYENSAGNFYIGRDSSTAGSFGGSAYAAVLYSSGAYPMEFWTASSKKMVITSGGNVGIGTSSINSKLTIYEGDIRLFKTHIINCTETWASNIFFTDEVDRKGAAIVGERTAWDGAPMALGFDTGGVGTITRRMTITSTGNVFFNRTANWSTFGDSGGAAISSDVNGSAYYAVYDGGESLGLSRRGSDGTIALFRRSTATVGTISVNSSATAYNTSSDYRLKQDFNNFNGLNIISNLKMYDFQWKKDSSRSFGAIAHELEEVIPYAVNGEKDAVDKDGEILPQGVDYSKLVPVLVKAIQELKAENDIFKTCLGIS